ncbi:MAG: DUF3223 domain-containing protein, partial [archaeon]|nr:DUF3223 domain-containing protein [archaeon]
MFNRDRGPPPRGRGFGPRRARGSRPPSLITKYGPPQAAGGRDRPPRGRGDRPPRGDRGDRGDRPPRGSGDRPFIRPKDMEAPAFFGANTRAIATADEPLSLVLGETALPITSYKETGAICRTLCLDSEPGTFLSGKDRDLLLALLVNGLPTSTQKLGTATPDLTQFRIQVNFSEDFPDTKCFWIIRPDGSGTDFSVRECLRNLFPKGSQKR